MKKSTKKPVGKAGASDKRKGWQKRFGQFSEGLSILLSMILITVIVLFSVGVTTIVIDSTRQASNVKEGTTAYYAAEAGLEQALWINKTLKDNDEALGAEEDGSMADIGGGVASVNFDIKGTTEGLLEKTVNGEYIIPFPWTGDAPWHGEGAVDGVGGCDPQKPPVRTGTGVDKLFKYDYVDANDVLHANATAEEQYHPCNWNKLSVGQKATIPLYGKDTNGGIHSFSSFTLRVRTPCAFGNEMCPVSANQRLELNCFDKGDEVKCLSTSDLDKQHKKGDVVLAWQIDAKVTATGDIVNLLPYQRFNLDNTEYHITTDSELFEGRLNNGIDETSLLFAVLNQNMSGVVGSASPTTISSFLSKTDQKEPVLKLSAVSDLIGCYGDGVSCNFYNDSPLLDNGQTNTVYHGPYKIPYLEYQVIIPQGSSYDPISPNNIITAEGQSGPFVQSIQVKAPNDETGLEYVIQQ